MIEVRDLRFTYPKAKEETIHGLNFEVKDGEIFGFLGPSGAGKSTTQKILIGLLKTFAGSITIMGKDIKSWDNSFYEKVGISFEQPNHFLKLTGLENLKLFRSFYSSETRDPEEVLELVGLTDSADKRVANYSKGMMMRLNFAKSILNKPKLLFLDEPTMGMDPVNARATKDTVLKFRDEGTTVFITTHNMHDADQMCDRVAFIVDGELKLIDEPREIKLQKGKNKVKVEYHIDHRTDSAEFPLEKLGDNEKFIELIKTKDIETIHSEEATLEDVFISVTGRTLQ